MIISHPTPALVPSLKELWQSVFGDTLDYINCFFDFAFSPLRALCACEGDTPVSMLYWLDCYAYEKRLAYIYAVATKEEYRGKGYARALLAKAEEELLQGGYSGIILVPSTPELFEFYEGLGFNGDIFMDKITVNAEKAPISFSYVTDEEYYNRRKMLLPTDAVIEERASISFLSRQATLLSGDDFVCAVRTQKDTLFCLDIAGNLDRLSALAGAFDLSKGVARVRGRGRFALFKPLVSMPTPTQFSLAFD